MLKDHDNPVWSVGANLLAPIYQGGALKTQVEIRTAEQKQAVAEYAVVGLRAFGEVEGALAAEIRGARPRADPDADARRQPARARRRADAVQGRQHRPALRRAAAAGAAGDAQSALIRVQAEQRVQRVNLHLALGGSFEAQPQP